VLDETEDETYSGIFTDTGLVGPYLFSVEASATTPLGNRVTRFRHFTGIIFVPGRATTVVAMAAAMTALGTGGFDEKDCKKRGLIKRLQALLERCCREAQREPT
jgi:hypothetical protein